MKIGFIDYYLDEYHANNYPVWLKNALGEAPEIFAYAEIDSPKPSGLTTDAWCKEHGAVRMSSIAEVCKASDAILLLSPDNPENHYRYAKEVFSYHKPVFIDKTFAVNGEDAERIIKLGEESGTPFFSSSSLRFAPEYAEWTHRAKSVVASGAGGEFDVELIHPIEICSAMMGCGVKDVLTNGDKNQLIVLLRYEDGRHATVNFTLHCTDLCYSAQVEGNKGKYFYAAKENFFQYLTDAIAAFFKNPKEIPVSHEDTLEAIRIRDAVLHGVESPYQWISVK